MPEGPSIVIIKEAIRPLLKGKIVTAATGNAKIDMDSITGEKVKDVRSWGKHLLICFPEFTVRIHFLLWGSYSINDQTRPDRSVRLCLTCGKQNFYFYTCSIRILEERPDDLYDWEVDLLNKKWNAAKARKKLKDLPDVMVCDAILDQDIFAGAGNIFKNEVLYRIKVHPETKIKNLPPRKLTELVKEVHNYAYDFLKWKKQFVLRQHWLAHTKRTCKRCGRPLTKKHMGKTKRRSFFCGNCQVKYV